MTVYSQLPAHSKATIPPASDSPGFGHEPFSARFARVDHSAVCGEPVVVEGSEHRVPFAALVTVKRFGDAVGLAHVLVPRTAQCKQLVAHGARVARLQFLRGRAGREGAGRSAG